ncbi:MAG TPA: LysM domain-containing protein [Gaiellaceae bacterium]
MTARPYIWPAAFLAAATLAVFGIRSAMHHAPAAPAKQPASYVNARPAAKYYEVRAGDTLAGVADRTGISATRLLELNPKLAPTALFLGQRIRLR